MLRVWAFAKLVICYEVKILINDISVPESCFAPYAIYISIVRKANLWTKKIDSSQIGNMQVALIFDSVCRPIERTKYLL